jgi:hypothetical protein
MRRAGAAQQAPNIRTLPMLQGKSPEEIEAFLALFTGEQLPGSPLVTAGLQPNSRVHLHTTCTAPGQYCHAAPGLRAGHPLTPAASQRFATRWIPSSCAPSSAPSTCGRPSRWALGLGRGAG